SRKHHLWNQKGEIHSRWRKYLIDFAYQLYILKQQYPDYSLLPLLVLPDKSGSAQTSGLPQLLNVEKQNKIASNIPIGNQQLLAKLDVSEPISQIHNSSEFARKNLPKDSFSESLDFLREVYLQKRKVEPQIGTKCQRCEFRLPPGREAEKPSGFDKCWTPEKNALDGRADHIFDLIGSGTKRRIADRIFYQQQIDSSELPSAGEIVQRNGRITEKMRQALQVHKTQGREVPQEIIRPALAKELRRWEYPFHFLDFEAGNYAVPIRAGRPPYHLVVFQFSSHTLHKDGSWEHHQWIEEFDSEYPNYELVRQLMQVPGINEGTIVQYSNFERNALKVIRSELQEESEMIPDSQWLIQWLEALIQRHDSTHSQPPYIADLSRQVRQYYYNSNMNNSLSIKDVLPSVMAQSSFLKEKYSHPYSSSNFDQFIWWRSGEGDKIQNPYDLLQEGVERNVQRGTEAMTLYGKLIAGDLSKKEQKRCYRSLLRYCELDTLAMMMIYEHWKHKMKQIY
ncbi:MAG TPA: DUF2779 domain-containing protein, partial [Fodinibius sp.]|nr:DUF2779 domain-containing protein [Fodinibius sp.]